MTVKELIEQLQTLDPDTSVFVRGYEGGYNNASPISNVVDMVLDYHDDWYLGKHELVEYCRHDSIKEYKIVKGIIL